jgi:hypothetical protein
MISVIGLVIIEARLAAERGVRRTQGGVMRGRRIGLFVAAFLMTTTRASAMSEYVRLWRLLQETDLAVVATLENVREWTADGTDFGEGTLVIESVVFGAPTPASAARLKWSNTSTVVCPRIEHGKHEGIRALWLLTAQPDGVVHAGDLGRFTPLADAMALRAGLRELADAPNAAAKDARCRAVKLLLERLLRARS